MNLQNLLTKFGVDKAIAYTLVSRSVQAFGSIFSLVLIANFLSKEEQGFYYTFGSILALQIFFELGFNGIIVQYVAHEAAHIKFFINFEKEIELQSISRLAFLLRFCVRWFSILSLGLLLLLVVIGFFFFRKYGKSEDVIWLAPWILLSVSTSVLFLLSPIMSFLEGLGKVKEIAKVRMVQQFVYMFSLWISLILNCKLFSSAIANCLSILTVIIMLFYSDYKQILYHIWIKKDKWIISYRKEIFPYQWKIAISWISGYFIFQLFNPVIFATDGAVVAGQMGMTMAVLNGVLNLTISWITTKVPTFSKFIALGDFSKLDLLFNKTVKQSLFVNFLGIITVNIIIYTLWYFKLPISERFLPLFLVSCLGIPIFLNQLTFSWATYLRCHKQEPYLIPSVVGAIAVACSTLLLNKLFGIEGIIIGYTASGFVFLPWNYYIFIRNKKIWHEKSKTFDNCYSNLQ